MTYLYKCEKCDSVVEVNKPMSESSTEENCKVCDDVMVRVYTAPSIKTGDGLK